MNFTRMFLYSVYSYVFVCTRMFLVCYPYVSRMYSYVPVCSVYYSYVTRMYSCGVVMIPRSQVFKGSTAKKKKKKIELSVHCMWTCNHIFCSLSIIYVKSTCSSFHSLLTLPNSLKQDKNSNFCHVPRN